MNRLVWSSDQPMPARADALPPSQRRPGEPARVLFVHTRELGFGTTTRNICDYAAARSDIDAVHIMPMRGPFWRAFSRNIPVLPDVLNAHGARQIVAWERTLSRLIHEDGPFPPSRFDAIHVMTQQRAAVLSRVRRARTAGPGQGTPKLVVNIDATAPAWRRMNGTRPIRSWPETAMERDVLSAADAVACASRWVLESAVNDLAAPREKCFLHMPCVRRPENTRPTPRSAPAGRRPRLLFVANDWIGKNGPRLLEWHQRRWAERAELVVVSKTAPRDDSARNVVWLGAVPHERLIGEVFPSADVLVMPTPRDTFLIVAQEAQLFGLPVVTTRLSGIQEVVRDGVSGLLCSREHEEEYIAAVERLLDEPGLLERLGQGALRHAQTNLNADRWHNHLLDMLVALADGRSLRLAPEGVDPEWLTSRTIEP